MVNFEERILKNIPRKRVSFDKPMATLEAYFQNETFIPLIKLIKGRLPRLIAPDRRQNIGIGDFDQRAVFMCKVYEAEFSLLF